MGEETRSWYEEELERERNQGQKRKPEKVSLLARILAWIASVLLFFTLLAGAFLFTVRNTVTQETIHAVIEEVIASEVEQNEEFFNSGKEEVIGYIQQNMDEELLEKYNLSEDNLNVLIDKEKMKDFMSDSALQYFDYLYAGGSEPQEVAGEIVNLLEEKKEEIYEVTGYQMEESDFQNIREALDKGQSEMVLPELNARNKALLQRIRAILSEQAFRTAVIFSVLWCVLIFILYRNSISSAFSRVGVTCLFAGIALFGIYRLVRKVASVLINDSSLTEKAVHLLYDPLSANLMWSMWVVFGAGVIGMVVSTLLRSGETRSLSR